MTRSEFMAAIKQIANERGITAEEIVETLERAMLAAYTKDYPAQASENSEVVVHIDEESGEVVLMQGSTNVTPPGFGRIAAQTAKQVILQGVREAEKQAVVTEFQGKLGEVVPGMLQRFERGSWLVDLGRTVAIMPREEQVYNEEYRNNQRQKFYIKEINPELPRNNITVSRSDSKLVEGLFELEIPELQSKAVVIKALSREPGSRSKIAVASTQHGVDPVGSMVGQRGVRVQTVTDELQGEKMDIILWSSDTEEFIKNALSPAQIVKVTIDEKNKTAKVEVEEEELSLAIGKEGQNVRLASKLTGYRIDIVSSTGQVFSQEVKAKKESEESVGEPTAPIVETTEEKESLTETSIDSDPKTKETTE
ncbi:transcription termination factor NusA [bacterium]|uniref:Transcription termination/antitermination protein NusA n=2 Tax=Katanobacteria TaxID=422282 RepID=A0A2M7X030_UNCKA|nr:transcription termination factor NusA [bacterium]PIP56267.1 MAG: transcription termination factor NusA [candidate division WWE3 bacterium CG22_combo_CG10-13_8_21_14_all_39_12]PJA39339.1 MAG: transcription termination factor NusA [candidate division WWE3 bacterium CG_4_9_14_3_um_filter_39_7]